LIATGRGLLKTPGGVGQLRNYLMCSYVPFVVICEIWILAG